MATSAGYSGTPLAKKLGIRDGMRIAVLGAPGEYREWLAPMPADVVFDTKASARSELVHLFTASAAELRKHLTAWRRSLAADCPVWVSWPKKTSNVPTGITEDDIRAIALPLGYVDIKVCAVSDVWSGLKLVVRKDLRQPNSPSCGESASRGGSNKSVGKSSRSRVSP